MMPPHRRAAAWPIHLPAPVMKKPMVITQGDAAGIGPEIIVKAWLEACHARPGFKAMWAAREAEAA